jgi:hypothetical protein
MARVRVFDIISEKLELFRMCESTKHRNEPLKSLTDIVSLYTLKQLKDK